jgi:hypothetical protein
MLILCTSPVCTNKIYVLYHDGWTPELGPCAIHHVSAMRGSAPPQLVGIGTVVLLHTITPALTVNDVKCKV